MEVRRNESEPKENAMKKPQLLVWQSPLFYKYGGLYLNIFGKRYRLIKWGVH